MWSEALPVRRLCAVLGRAALLAALAGAVGLTLASSAAAAAPVKRRNPV
jgi:hypothetical protein